MAVARSGEPNFYWLRPRRGSTAGSLEALQQAMMRMAKENPQQGRLIEEEEEAGEGEAAVYSSGGTIKLA